MKHRSKHGTPLSRVAVGLLAVAFVVVCTVLPSLGGPRNPRMRVGSANIGSAGSVEGAAVKASLPAGTALVSTNGIILKANAAVTGDIVVNQDGSPPFLSSAVEDVTFDRGASVTGDLYGNDIQLKKNCGVTGGTIFVNNFDNDCNSTAPTAAYGAPVFGELPAFSEGTPGGADVIVEGGQVVTLTPTESQGGIIDVKNGGKLIFEGGTYDYEMFDTRSNAIVEFTEPTILRISGLFDVDPGSTFGPQAGSGINASDITVYVAGAGDPPPSTDLPAIELSRDSFVDANFYSPNGTFRTERNCTFNGAAIARDIYIGNGSVVVAVSGFSNAPPTADPKAVDTVDDGAVEITLSGNDPEGEDLTFAIEVSPTLGTLSAITPIVPDPVPELDRDTGLPTGNFIQPPITSATTTYTPTDPGDPKDEEDGFTYSVADTGGAMGLAAVSINADDGVVPDTPLSAVDAIDSAATTPQGSAVTVTLEAGATTIPDPADPMICPPPSGTGPCLPEIPLPLTFSIVAATGPSNGTLGTVDQGPPGTVEYTPTGSFSGTDSFQFLVEGDVDGSGSIDQPNESDTATATITVDELAPDLNVTTNEDEPLPIDLSSATGLGGGAAPLGEGPTVVISALSPAPVAGVVLPNLAFTAFSAPACAALSEVIGDQISVTLTNNGAADIAVGTSSSIGFYVSTDSIITTADTLLIGGRENLSSTGLAAGASIADFLFAGASIAAASPTGNVFIGVVADEFDSIIESNEADNTASQAIEILASGSCLTPNRIISSAVAGNVADADEDGFGDNKNNLPGSTPGLISAGVNVSGGAGSNGTVRIHIEWDVSNIGTEDDVTSAQVTLNTHRGTVDSLDTVLSAGILFGNGALDNSDFETFLQAFPPEGAGTAATMPVPSGMAVGSDGTFSFDVTTQLKEALQTGLGFFTIQGRVLNEFNLVGGTTFARGLEVRSSATGNLTLGLEPQLAVDTSFVAPVYTITSLPLNGTLTDSTGTAITATPTVLADPNLTYTGSLGFFGAVSFSYEAAGAIVDTGIVTVTVVELDCLLTVLGCDDGR